MLNNLKCEIHTLIIDDYAKENKQPQLELIILSTTLPIE